MIFIYNFSALFFISIYTYTIYIQHFRLTSNNMYCFVYVSTVVSDTLCSQIGVCGFSHLPGLHAFYGVSCNIVIVVINGNNLKLKTLTGKILL